MQEKKLALSSPVRYIKGVGPKRAQILSRLGLEIVEDILYYLPLRYEDRSEFTPIKDVKIGEYNTIKGEVITISTRLTKRRINVLQVKVADKTGIITCVWFNQPFLKKFFKEDQDIIVYGKVEKYDRLQINHPEYEIIKKGKRPKGVPSKAEGREKSSLNIGRIVPIYSLTQDISQRNLRFVVHEAISNTVWLVRDTLPTHIRARNKLVDLKFALQNIHFPYSSENLEKSYKRIVFEEFFLLQVALALKRHLVKEEIKGIRHKLDAKLMDSFKALFPFELTQAQLKAINEIQMDMASPRPMNRLLEGDVASGKTAVALYALCLTVQNGFQGVIMAPTEILARQHFINISKFLMPLGIDIRLLISGLPLEKKLSIKKEIESGEVDIVIGTHALIQEDVAYKKLGLIIVDEQHKFGVTQRKVLKEKGLNPDVLLMTATPIPRTLALTVYGDLDISVLREMPRGRKPISTYWVEENRRDKVYAFIRDEVDKGRQAYIVYPRIEKKEGSFIKAATHMYEKLRDEVFPDIEIALLHGRMATKEKEKIMKRFKSKRTRILVSTVVVEVGIDVANASIMVIENAERFGLAQLHQLRGRIGRGEYNSYCILLGNPRTERAEKRLKAMSETLDGFKIAEEDLELRGPGEFFGTRQHGLPELRFGNILKDFEIMEKARIEAFTLVASDANLSDARNVFLRENLKRRFKGKLDLIHVG